MAARAVLFDLDGTLVDTAAFLLRSMRHAFELAPERAPTDARWIAGIGTPLRTQLAEFARDAAEVEALVQRYRAFQKAHLEQLTRTFPGADALVRRLRARGTQLAVVTSKGQELAERTLAFVGLLEQFDVVVSADSVARAKPDPMPVHFALERLGVAASQALFAGDSPHDVAAGNAAGVTSVGVLWGPFSRAQLEGARPRHLAETFDALAAIIDAHP